MEVPQLLSIEDVAARLMIDTRTVRRLINAGKFPVAIHPTDGSSAWYPEDVIAYLHNRFQKSRYQVRTRKRDSDGETGQKVKRSKPNSGAPE